MLLFKPEHVPKILDGTKTATRRMGNKRWKKDSIHEAKTGYSTDSKFAKIRITAEPYQQELCQMTAKDAWDEGHYTLHHCVNKKIDKIYLRVWCKNCRHSESCFQPVWVNINGAWDPNLKPWVLWFERVKENPLLQKPIIREIQIPKGIRLLNTEEA